jgi:hypothetical protein
MAVKELYMKYMYMKNRKMKQCMFFMIATDQFLTVYSLYWRSWELFNFFISISGIKEFNMKYMYMKNRKNATVHVFYDRDWSVFNNVSLYSLFCSELGTFRIFFIYFICFLRYNQ